MLNSLWFNLNFTLSFQNHQGMGKVKEFISLKIKLNSNDFGYDKILI